MWAGLGSSQRGLRFVAWAVLAVCRVTAQYQWPATCGSCDYGTSGPCAIELGAGRNRCKLRPYFSFASRTRTRTRTRCRSRSRSRVGAPGARSAGTDARGTPLLPHADTYAQCKSQTPRAPTPPSSALCLLSLSLSLSPRRSLPPWLLSLFLSLTHTLSRLVRPQAKRTQTRRSKFAARGPSSAAACSARSNVLRGPWSRRGSPPPAISATGNSGTCASTLL